MKRLLLIIAALAICTNTTQGQELLSNPDLNQIHQVGPTSDYWPEFVDWTFTTNPCSYSPCPITPYVPGQFYTQYSGYPATFADQYVPVPPDPNNPTEYGFVGTSFEGYYPFEIVGDVDIDISQVVPVTAGQLYRFSGWAHFEGGYAGGVEFLDLLSPNQRNQDAQMANPGVPVASLTDTVFSMEFLDPNGAIIGSPLEYELHDDGGQMNDNELDGRTWMRHVLKATAPAGAVSLRVRAGMFNGEFNIDAPHQSVFMDNFSVRAVPEPTTAVLGMLGLVLVCGRRRNK